MTGSGVNFRFESWIPAFAGMTKKGGGTGKSRLTAKGGLTGKERMMERGGRTGIEGFFRRLCVFFSAFFILTALFLSSADQLHAIDTEVTRMTLSGLQGVYVAVEELQPNLMKYDAAQKAGLSQAALQQEIEARLSKAGIRVLTWDQALKTPGSPFLYVVVNTHESEKYWYAYDIRIELQQIVSMEANPKVRAMAGTWSTNMTGIANIGKLQVIRDDVGALVGKFVQAYGAANKK